MNFQWQSNKTLPFSLCSNGKQYEERIRKVDIDKEWQLKVNTKAKCDGQRASVTKRLGRSKILAWTKMSQDKQANGHSSLHKPSWWARWQLKRTNIALII